MRVIWTTGTRLAALWWMGLCAAAPVAAQGPAGRLDADWLLTGEGFEARVATSEDGRDIDWMLHVNPRLETRGLLVLFNPLDEPARRTVRVPLYYTGLTGTATVRHEGGDPLEVARDRHDAVDLGVTVPARGFTWYLIER